MSALVLCLLLSSPADQLGFGSAGAALAGSAVAEPPGTVAAFRNPAYAAVADSVAATIGYGFAALRFAINGQDQQLDSARATVIGLVCPFDLSSWGRLGVSAAVSLPDQRIIRARVVPTDTPRFLFYDNRLQRIGADAALSYAYDLGAVTVGAAGGFTLLTGAAGDGTTFFLYQSGDYQTADASVDNEMPLAIAPLAALFARYEGLSLGLYVRRSVQFDLAIATRADIRFGPLGGDIASSVVSTDFFTPLKVAGGLAWTYDQWTLHGALEFHRWSGAPPLTARWVSDVSVAGFSIDLPESQPAPQPFRDVWVPRLGLEHAFVFTNLRITARVGGAYEPAVVSHTRSAVFLDADKLSAAAGLGLTLPTPLGLLDHPLSVDTHVLGTWLASRRFPSQGPTDIHPDVVADGHLICAGVTLTLRF